MNRPVAAVLKTETEVFATEHLKADLGSRSIRGGAVTVTAQALQFALQTASTMILARLLTPADYGLIAMVAAFTGFVGLFKDLGLSAATVQRAEITHDQVSALFWTNTALGAALAVLTAALAPLVSWFYGEPRLTWVTACLGVTFLLGGLGTQHTALLRRQMRFGSLAAIQLISVLSGAATAILLAWNGAGYWALVGLTASTVLVNTLLVWILSPWRPGRPRSGSGVKELIAFGGHVTGINCINYMTATVDRVLIASVWGAGPVGIYSKAYALLLLPLQQVNVPIASVAIPALSRLQDDPERFRRFYCRIIQLIAYATMPVVVLLAVLSDEAILIVLGPQWGDAAVIFRIFAFFALFYPVFATIGWVMISLGRTRQLLKLCTTVSVVSIAAFVAGLPWGPPGVAVGATLSLGGSIIPSMVYAFRGTSISLADIGAATGRPFVLAVLLALSTAAAYQLTASGPIAARVIAVVLTALAAAGGLVAVWRPIRDDVRAILALRYR